LAENRVTITVDGAQLEVDAGVRLIDAIGQAGRGLGRGADGAGPRWTGRGGGTSYGRWITETEIDGRFVAIHLRIFLLEAASC